MAKREMKYRNTEETKIENVEQSAPVVEETKKEESSVSLGVVVGCTKLNIRKEPKIDSHVVLVVDAGAELKVIDVEKATGDWYKVITANKVHGFCMKKYVKLV